MPAPGKFVGICAERCPNCLLGENALVAPAVVRSIVDRTLAGDAFFVCHQATARGVEAFCRGWWDDYRSATNAGRIAERLGMRPSWRPDGPPVDVEYAEWVADARRELRAARPGSSYNQPT